MDNLLTTPESLRQEAVWEQIQAVLKDTLSDSGFQTFLSTVKFVDFSNNVIHLQVQSQFSKNWVKEHCEKTICNFIESTTYEKPVIHYAEFSQKEQSNQLDMFKQANKEQEAKTESAYTTFNPKFTFENFVVGHNNRFAHAASEAVAKAPAKAYNPLFIYGSVGLGKTHLMHAIGHRVSELYPEKIVKCVSSERFTNDMINAIKDKQLNSFRNQYRNADILLIDDIQFLAGKEQTQEEFFHTFNELHGQSKQIIIASDRPPKDIPTLEDRLRTRFEWGLIADIQPPEFETRIAILRKKTELSGLVISDEVLHFLATQIPSNVREMEGALTRIVAYASLLDTEVTLSIASNVIQDLTGIRQETPISISLIKRKVCDYFQIAEVELCSKNRTKELAYARQIAMYLARELTNVSLPKIGENFGKRDHSTVMHACDKIKSSIKADPDTSSIVNILLSNIKNND